MELGAILVLIAIVLAAVSFFVDRDRQAHRLLAAAVILAGIGTLIGAGGLVLDR